MFHTEEYVDIVDFCTLRVGGKFRYFVRVNALDQVHDVCLFAREKNLPLFILGSGSNIVFNDGVLECVVVKIELSGFDVVNETDEYIDIKIGAGENWDSFVKKTVSMNLSGVEALSAIPGTVGATPVQNVGAYGQEVKDTIVSVEVYDTQEHTTLTFSKSDCAFSYRDSIFKHEAKGRYIILSVTFRLSKLPPTLPDYPGVKKYFIEKGVASPTLLQIREAITEIRRVKLPNPKEIPNVGSFFKNAVVPTAVAEELKKKYPTLVTFVVDEQTTKVPAGWLIENAGLKGKDFGPLSTYAHNALVLVNNGTATRADVTRVKDEIIQTVSDTFGIILETEPEFV